MTFDKDPFKEYYREIGGRRQASQKEEVGDKGSSQKASKKTSSLVSIGLGLLLIVLAIGSLGGIYLSFKYPSQITKLKEDLENKSLAQVACQEILDKSVLARAQATFDKAVANIPKPKPGNTQKVDIMMKIKLPSGRIEEFRHNVSNEENARLY